jgi:copper chaperone CopZ
MQYPEASRLTIGEHTMIEFEVEGMSCGGCVKSVTKAIQSADPAAKVEVDLPTKKVKVETHLRHEVVTEAIIDAGYEVSAWTVH